MLAKICSVRAFIASIDASIASPGVARDQIAELGQDELRLLLDAVAPVLLQLGELRAPFEDGTVGVVALLQLGELLLPLRLLASQEVTDLQLALFLRPASFGGLSGQAARARLARLPERLWSSCSCVLISSMRA